MLSGSIARIKSCFLEESEGEILIPFHRCWFRLHEQRVEEGGMVVEAQLHRLSGNLGGCFLPLLDGQDSVFVHENV